MLVTVLSLNGATVGPVCHVAPATAIGTHSRFFAMFAFFFAVVIPSIAYSLPPLAQVIPVGCLAAPTTYSHVRYASPTTFQQTLKIVEPGDMIYLDSGNYGAVKLGTSNGSIVSVAAAPGQTPEMSSLAIKGNRWLIQGITITGLAPPALGIASSTTTEWQTHPALVTITGGNNIILSGNTINSQPGIFPWVAEAVATPDPHATSSGIVAQNGWCITLYHNSISNIFDGIQIGGDQLGSDGMALAVVGNMISDFAGDGIDHFGSHLLIQNNVIWNAHGICNDICVHNDGIQGWNYNDVLGITNTNVTIDGNIVILSITPSIAVLADDLHGITIFDGFWTDVIITNNVISTGAWNGISIGGVNNLKIVNNTVVSLPSTGHVPWIQTGFVTHEGGSSNNTTVRNNIVPTIIEETGGNPKQFVSKDHNLQTSQWTLAQVEALFAGFEPSSYQFNFGLQTGTLAVGMGTPLSAPTVDIKQVPRSTPFDLGAYQFDGTAQLDVAASPQKGCTKCNRSASPPTL